MKDLAKYNPLIFKFPLGAISKGKKVQFKVEVNLKCVPNELYLMLKKDEDNDYKYISMEQKNNFFETEIYFENSGHYYYNFKINYNDFYKYLSCDNNYFSIVLNEKGNDFFQLVTEQEYTCSDSLQGGIIYQIMVDRFCRVGEVNSREPLVLRDDWCGEITKNTTNPVLINEEVFGGNFDGIISKLNYLSELGVTAIYLNPISFANSHHKYDTADYMTIDEMFGGEEKFKNLIDKAREFNIKIIIDGVYNHTGSDSIYFNKNNRFASIGAYNSVDSKYFDWYEFQEYPRRYKCWWGINTLPSIKRNSQSFHEFIAGDGGVIEKFMKMGVSGIRLDVVDEISDNLTKLISDKVLSFDKNAIVMGEVWEDAATKISYGERRKYFSNNEINSVMNYLVRDAIINYLMTREPKLLFSTCRTIQNNYPKVVMDNLMNILGTHDTTRIFSLIKNISNGNFETASDLYKIAMGILFTLPGVPSIFYGDEYGLENNSGSCRGCFDWNKNNNELYFWIKHLAKIRKYSALKNGEFNILFASNGKFVFERFDKNSHIIVLTNLRPTPLKINIEGKFKSFFNDNIIENFILNKNKIEILIEL